MPKLESPKSIHGYIVADMDAPHMPGFSYCVGGIEEDSLALWDSDETTVFHSRREAQKAIRRTKAYARVHGLVERWGPYKIFPVSLEIHAGKKGRHT